MECSNSLKYIIGLDIGTTSVGYAALMLDDKDIPCRILRLGSRIFDLAENLNGSSHAAPRRENRGMRRRQRRKRLRKSEIKSLISENNIMTGDEIKAIYNSKGVLSDIYQIRAEAIDRNLNKEEFVRLLIHLSQRRGFKSNRKVDSNNKKSEAGTLLIAIEENKKILNKNHYRTIGEMLYKDKKFTEYKRNKSDSNKNSFTRKEHEEEIKCIFESQRKFGNKYATKDLEEKYLKIFLSQRAFDDGPGANSPYAGNQIEKMLGHCTLEPDQFRAVKASYSFEYFNLLSKVNHIKILSSGTKRPLSPDERSKVISLAFNKNSITYASIRNALKLSQSETFNISYGEKSIDEIEKKTKFTYLKAYHTMKKAYGDSFNSWSTDKKNNLGYALSVYKNDSKIISYLTDKNFDETEIKIALTLPSFSKTGNLSVKALDKINPYLEQGMVYSDACISAGYNFKADDTEKSKYLPANPMVAEELQDIKNPVVKRAVSQTIKVVNALIREYGSPCYVNAELARELAKNFKDKKEIEKGQKENRAKNERIMERLRSEFGLLQPTGLDLVKLKLWEEQDGICPYSLKPIKIERLFETGYVEIDHIIPYSLTFDDSYNNKVLVLSSENRQKGNKIPMQYLSGKQKDSFYVWVENSNLKSYKKKNLLKESLSKDDLSRIKSRSLNDTRYISRFILNYIKKYLEFEPNSTNNKKTVTAVNGAATAYIRKRWGINKIRENGDIHHAVDAVVIASVTDSIIRLISEYSKYHETEYDNPKTGEVVNRFPMPYPYFKAEIDMLCSEDPSVELRRNPLPNYATDEHIEPVFVSRMPKHKNTGAAHEDTIRKPYCENGINYVISKVPLSSLELKNGEIKDYYNASSDMLLYNALKKRLEQSGGKGTNAFKDPFYKPKSDGTQGPLVKKVKTIQKATLTVDVQNKTAVAKNDSIIRTDVFYVEGEGYYLVPIYVSDTVKKVLPNKAVVGSKSYNDWKVMNDENFIFSLYPSDLIRVVSNTVKKFSLVNKNSTLKDTIDSKDIFLYFKKTKIANAAITVINHDNTYTIPSLGVKELLKLEKYQVDVLGNKSKCGKEKRMGFN